jgi:parvulin-like peptidyl-prolyl isomerase
MVNYTRRLIFSITLCSAMVLSISPVSAQLFKKKPKPAPTATVTTATAVAPTTSQPTSPTSPVKAVKPPEIIIATYKGGEYTGSDLTARLRSISPYERMAMEEEGKETEFKTRFVKEAILDRILYPEALKQKLDNNPVFQYMVNDKENMLLVNKLYQVEVNQKSKITDADIKNYYDKHSTEFINPAGEQFKIRYIFVDAARTRKTEEEKAEAYKKISEAYQKLKEGKDFVEIAKQYSESDESMRGQVAGPYSRNTIIKEMETAALALKPGEISGIVTTKHGYNIVKLEDYMPALIPFDRVKPGIQGKLRQEIANTAQTRIFDSVTTYKNYAALEQTTTAITAPVPATVGKDTTKKKYLLDAVGDYAKSSGLISDSTTAFGSKTLAEFLDRFDLRKKSNPILLKIVRKAEKSEKKETLASFFSGKKTPGTFIFTLADMKTLQQDPRTAPQWSNIEMQKRSLDRLAQVVTFALEAKAQGLDKDPAIVKQVQEFKEKELANLLLNKKVEKRLVITNQDIKEFYAKNSSMFITQKQIFARMILIKTPRGNQATTNLAKDSCWQVYSKLTAGADFNEMAKEYSQGLNPDKGGELGWVFMGPSGYMFDTAAFALKKGEFSIPVPQREGYGIIKVDDIREPRLQALDEVWDKAKDGVTNEKRDKLTKQITDETLNSAKFKLYEKELAKVSL